VSQLIRNVNASEAIVTPDGHLTGSAQTFFNQLTTIIGDFLVGALSTDATGAFSIPLLQLPPYSSDDISKMDTKELVPGMVLFNTTTGVPQYWNGSGFVNF